MKKLTFTLLSILILLSLVWIPTFSAGATVDRITICTLETDISKIPGKVWLSEDGTILHVRGQTTISKNTPLPGHPECDLRYSQGELVMTVNFNINLTNGEGEAWGSTTSTPTGIDGTFVGPFSGKIHAGAFYGKSVDIGTGALEGLIERVTIQQIGVDTYEVLGYVYARQ